MAICRFLLDDRGTCTYIHKSSSNRAECDGGTANEASNYLATQPLDHGPVNIVQNMPSPHAPLQLCACSVSAAARRAPFSARGAAPGSVIAHQPRVTSSCATQKQARPRFLQDSLLSRPTSFLLGCSAAWLLVRSTDRLPVHPRRPGQRERERERERERASERTRGRLPGLAGNAGP